MKAGDCVCFVFLCSCGVDQTGRGGRPVAVPWEMGEEGGKVKGGNVDLARYPLRDVGVED